MSRDLLGEKKTFANGSINEIFFSKKVRLHWTDALNHKTYLFATEKVQKAT